MNILLIIIFALFGVSAFAGYKKGFLKTAFSLVSWILVLVLCNMFSPMVTDALIANTDIEVTIKTTIDAKISEVITETVETSGAAELEASLPAELKTALLGENGSLQDVISNGAAFDTTSLVNGIVGIVGFVITAIILRIAAFVVEIVLGVVSKLPLIGPMDKMLGLACGGVKGLIWCWVILAVVAVLALTGVNTEFSAYISESPILTWLQDNNVLLNLIVSIK